MIITGNVGWGICARGEGSRPWESGSGGGGGEYGCGVKKCTVKCQINMTVRHAR